MRKRKVNQRTPFMPAALTLTKASPVAREGFGTCSSLSTDSMTPFCANRRAFMVVLSMDTWKSGLTPWFDIFTIALGAASSQRNEPSSSGQITCIIPSARPGYTATRPSLIRTLSIESLEPPKNQWVLAIITSLILRQICSGGVPLSSQDNDLFVPRFVVVFKMDALLNSVLPTDYLVETALQDR